MADPDIPVAYGTPIDPVAVAAAPPARNLQATSAVMGRSSRVVLPSSPTAEAPLDDSTWQALQEQGFTRGLATALVQNKRAFPLCFWVVDNSGSMNTQDGHKLVTTKGKNRNKNNKSLKFVQSTRWAEMQQTVDYHAQMAALLQQPTVFRLLNDPGRVHGPQQFSVAENMQTIDHDLAVAQSVIANTRPSGVTPLHQHVTAIRDNIQQTLQPQLLRDGTQVVVVLATDGTPTDSQGHATAAVQQQFRQALQSLQGLPVWLVIRLCTDDDDVVEYWNGLDEQLELNLEVLDDFAAEAAEVHQHNPWLNYALPLHRLREMGFYHRTWDLLDERRLSVDGIARLFGHFAAIGRSPRCHGRLEGLLCRRGGCRPAGAVAMESADAATGAVH